MHDYRKHEVTLVCPKCGLEFETIMLSEVKETYACVCGKTVKTIINHHEIFYINEK